MSHLLRRFFKPQTFRVAVIHTKNMSTIRRLEGKVAVVTASTEGIGFAIARRLGQEGAKVVVSSRRAKKVESAVNELKAEKLEVYGTVCHAGKAEDRKRLIEETVKQYGGLDILVSNVGTNPAFGHILDVTEDSWDKIFDNNVKASLFMVKEAVPYMEERGGGSVVLVSSIGGYNPFELIAPYSISKTALLGMVKGLVPQLTRLNIRVNCIAPGLIKTNFSKAMWTAPGADDQFKATIPIGRLGRPDECAGAVAFLASEDASYITGETIVIAGGMNARL